MGNIDWSTLASMLGAIGTLLVGIAAILTLFFQFGYRAKSKRLESSLKSLLNAYRSYMSKEEGVVWADYPKGAHLIVSKISNKTGIDEKLVRGLLDDLKSEGVI